MKQHSRVAYSLVFLITLIWGNNFVAIKVALNCGLTPGDLIIFRYLPASIIFLFILAIRRSWNLPRILTSFCCGKEIL